MKSIYFIRERKYIILAIMTYVVGVIGFAYFMYQAQKEKHFQQIDEKLLKASNIAHELLGDDYYERAKNKDSISMDEFTVNARKLTNVAALYDITYLWSAVIIDNEVYITSSSASDPSESDWGNYFEHYYDAQEHWKKNFHKNQPTFSNYSDHWGNFRTLTLPMRTPSGHTYAIGADMAIGDVNQLLKESVLASLGIALFFLFMLFPIIFFYNKDLFRLIRRHEKKILEQESELVEDRKLLAINELLRSIAHHWRQPLNVITMTTENIADQCTGLDIDHQKFEKSINTIRYETQGLSRTVNTFSGLFQQGGAKRHFKLNKILEDLILVVHPELSHTNTTINCKCSDECEIHASPGEFSRTFLSLIQNSQESIQEVQKEVQEYKGKIEINLFKTDEMITITLTDNGKGIDPEFREKLFEPYTTTKFKSRGTGLSLYLVKLFIEEKLGGSISFDFTVREGACVLIQIPQSA